MSSIYFHGGIEGEALVNGAERAHFGISCSDIAWSFLDSIAKEWRSESSVLRNIFPPDHYVLQSKDFAQTVERWFRVGFEPIRLGDKKIDPFSIKLNTACFLGSDPLRLAARLHGQCELHAYVEGHNRKWLADIIRRGRQFKFFRDEMGWETVIDLLEQNDNRPIVTSYSTGLSFPNSDVANFEYPVLDNGKEDWDAWDDMSGKQKWALGIKALRQSDVGLELEPENWDSFYFGDGIDANMLVSLLYK